MPDRRKQQPLSKKCTKFMKTFDKFGVPISLTYKEQPEITSAFGGLISLLAVLGLIGFLLYQFSLVFNHDCTIKTSITQRDLTVDDHQYNLTQDNFDIGFYTEYTKLAEESIEFQLSYNIYQYIYPRINQNIATYSSTKNSSSDKVKIEVETTKCTTGRLGLTVTSKDWLKVNGNYLCPKDFNFALKGSQASQQYQYLNLEIKKCNQTYLNTYYAGQKCAADADQERVLKHIKLFVLVQNSYFDETDFTANPIKNYLKPYFLYTSHLVAQHYILHLGIHQVELNDDMFYGSPKYKEFVETELNYITSETLGDYSNIPLVLNIQFDESKKKITRNVKTFIQSASASGGFMTAIFVIANLIVSRFQRFTYFSTLIKSFYEYQARSTIKRMQNLKLTDAPNLGFKRQHVRKLTEEEVPPLNDKFAQILQQINARRKLIHGWKDQLRILCRKMCCKALTNRQHLNEKLYSKGMQKLNKDLDIRTITEEVRNLKFITQVLLTKYQRFLIPYFKSNLLNHRGQTNKVQEQKFLLEKFLQAAMKNENASKTDARILKNIKLSESEDDSEDSLTEGVRPQSKRKSHQARPESTTARKQILKPALQSAKKADEENQTKRDEESSKRKESSYKVNPGSGIGMQKLKQLP